MEPSEFQSRLSRISTIWKTLDQAHDSSSDRTQAAQLAMIQQYQGAVYKYLVAACGHADAADDLFQEFALRVVRGSFGQADPRRGRFRDYLRVALSRMVTDFHRRNKKKEAPLLCEEIEAGEGSNIQHDLELAFDRSWRDELLRLSWQRLQEYDQQHSTIYYTVLTWRKDRPDATARELADYLSTATEREPSEVGARKILERARMRFAQIVIHQVRQSLNQPARDELQDELVSLGLLSYCRPALDDDC